jgi:hypothetical protein
MLFGSYETIDSYSQEAYLNAGFGSAVLELLEADGIKCASFEWNSRS